MPDSNTMSTNAAGFYLDYTAAASGDKTFEFKTENKFVDQNIRFNLTVPAAAGLAVENNNVSTLLTMGSASNGIYSPSTTLDLVTRSDGWVADGTHLASSIVGTVNQSTMTLGDSALASGSTVNPGPSTQTITISEGYNAARTIIVGTTSSGEVGSATAKSVSITSGSIAYNSSTSKFDLTATADNPAPTVVAGWISSGTALTDGVSVNIALDKVELTITQPDPEDLALTASIIKLGDSGNVATGTWTTTQPSSGFYIKTSSATTTNTFSVPPKVKTAGYGTTSYYSTDSPTITISANANTTYIPVTAATFANTATNNVTYTDISSTAPALISGSYLFINEGYTGNVKISLAKLVPDASDNASASYILSGYTAYNNDGTLLVGTIQTYAGAYEIVT